MSVTRRLTVAALVLLLVVAVIGISWAFPTTGSTTAFDLQVYLGAVQAMLSGSRGGLYGFALPDVAGPATFLYPPFAAVLMIPAAQASFGSMATAWLLVQVGLCLLMVFLVLRRSGRAPGDGIGSLLADCGGFLLVALSSPILSGVSLGQLSLPITAMVVADVLVLPPRWRGLLIGLAAAIKLTPIVFVLFFLVTAQRRAAVNATASFAVATSIGFLALPAESLQYWTSVLFDRSRVPSIGTARNLSLLGTIQAWHVPESWQLPAWLLVGSLLGAAALRSARRHYFRGETVASLLVMGIASAVLSPVAWAHFLVWLPLTALYLALGPFRTAQRTLGWTALVLLNLVSPVWPGGAWPSGDRLGLGLVITMAAICITGLPRVRAASDAQSEDLELTPRAGARWASDHAACPPQAGSDAGVLPDVHG